MADLTELHKRLEEELERLNSELEQFKLDTKSAKEAHEGSPFGKTGEEATETFEFGKRVALEQQLADALIEVNHAMEKYEAGTYGTCDSCGQPIDPARLEALPHASLCLNCKASQAKDYRSR